MKGTPRYALDVHSYVDPHMYEWVTNAMHTTESRTLYTTQSDGYCIMKDMPRYTFGCAFICRHTHMNGSRVLRPTESRTLYMHDTVWWVLHNERHAYRYILDMHLQGQKQSQKIKKWHVLQAGMNGCVFRYAIKCKHQKRKCTHIYFHIYSQKRTWRVI